VTVKQIDILASMAFQTIGLARYPVARVLHCVAATVATLGSNEEAAGVIMESHVDGSEDGPVNAMLQMIIIKEDQELRGNGHTRAAATTGCVRRRHRYNIYELLVKLTLKAEDL
jgi:hypothetical protein